MTEEERFPDFNSTLLSLERIASVRQMRLVAAALTRRLRDCPHDGDEPKRCDDLIEAAADAPRPWDEVLTQLEMRPGTWRHSHILYPAEVGEIAMELRKLIHLDALPAGLQDYCFWLVREVLGDPRHEKADLSRWRTRDVLALCDKLYEQSAFDRLPILADALEEAGCTDAEILLHLRSPGPHVRGCWALDLVLGKT